MTGAFCVLKPEGLTSSDVVIRLKIALTKNQYAERGFRIGHGGTLDPFATGVLVILVGEATKLADTYLHSKKEYTGIIQLGSQTDSADLTGNIISRAEIPLLETSKWNQLAQSFVNEPYFQIPPMHSAKKKDGKALYTLARKGEVVDREAILKKIFVFEVSLEDQNQLRFRVECESGTYIRVLAEDLAKKGATLAHLIKLERTQSSDVGLQHCQTLEAILQSLSEKTPLDQILSFKKLSEISTHIPEISVLPGSENQIRNGLTHVLDSLCEKAFTQFSDRPYVLARLQRMPIALLENKKEASAFRVQRIFIGHDKTE